MITWVASYPKSGNTWVRLLIDAYFSGKCDINQIGHCISDQDRYFYNALAPRGELSQGEITCLRPAALLHMCAAIPHRPLFVKTHNANADIDGLSAQPPSLTKSAIYCIRDPRDVAISNANHFGTSIDESIEVLNSSTRAIGDDNFLHYLGSWSDHVKSWTGGESFPVIGVKYEKLLKSPVDTFCSMLDKIGVDVDKDRAEKAVKMASFDNLATQEDEAGFKERPEKMNRFFKTGCSTWRSTLTNEQINRIEKAHSEVMVKHGYDPVTL